MALLLVQALSEDAIASPGNRNPNYIVVSVTDANGVPLSGLAASNFKVDPMVVGPGGALVNITSCNPGRDTFDRHATNSDPATAPTPVDAASQPTPELPRSSVSFASNGTNTCW